MIIVDVVDDVTWSSSPVSNMRRLDFTGNAGLHNNNNNTTTYKAP